MSVLIVDDESEILKTLRLHFDLEQIEVQTASSAEEALDLQKKHLHPVCLTDIRMPTMSGVELIREIKKMNPTCIVFVMTGYASLMSMTECLEVGAVDYFIKPFENLETVTKTIREAIERHQRWKRDLLGLKKVRA